LPKAREVKDKCNVGIGTMKFKEVKEKKQEELQEMLKNLRIKLGKLLFDLNSNSLKDFSQVQKTKKDIARILTALKLTVSN